MAYAVLVPNRIMAMNVDSLNRNVLAGSGVDYQNGSVFRLDSKVSASAISAEVWTPTAPSTNGSTMAGLWMAYSPEIVITVSGTKQYRGIDPDPRSFTNIGGIVFDAYRPAVGDIITLTADAFTGTQNTYANAVSGSTNLTWGAAQSTQTGGVLSFRYLKTTWVSIGSGAIDNQRATAYELECIAN